MGAPETTTAGKGVVSHQAWQASVRMLGRVGEQTEGQGALQHHLRVSFPQPESGWWLWRPELGRVLQRQL